MTVRNDKPRESDGGEGFLLEEYPRTPLNPLEYDPDVRYEISKLIVDRAAQTVKMWITPEGARRSQDQWVSWLRWSITGGAYSEQLDVCPFWGAIDDLPGFNNLADHVILSGPGVTITDTRVQGKVTYTSAKGTAEIEFSYDLKPK